jgi:uncharacterized protein (TIGR02452 family)
MNNTEIGFFTPISFGDLPRKKIDYIMEAFDEYFCWGNHKAFVLQGDSIKGVYEVELKLLPHATFNLCSVIVKIIKILSYIPFGIPALLIKGALRFSRKFTLVTQIQNPSKTNENTLNLSDSFAQVLMTRREETEKIRCPIALMTGRATTEGFYTSPSGKKNLLHSGEQLLKGSRVISNSNLEYSMEIRYEESKIVVVDRDCLKAAEEEIKNGAKKVAVLMFASPLEPGGAMEEGNNGQEEDLCRRSDIFGFMWDQSHFIASTSFYNLVDLKEPHQVDPKYTAMVNNRMIHVPQVNIFRSGKNANYEMLEKPFEVGMLISPALDRPGYEKKNEKIHYKRIEDEEQLCKLIMTQLKVSYEENYDTVILGAFGCGAFCNPPELIAEFYKRLIEKYFKGAFKKVVFAILDDGYQAKHNPEGNLKPFQKCFESV